MKGKVGFWLAAVFALAALLMTLGSGGAHTASQEEKRIAEVLGSMDGAGKVEVALFYSQSGTLDKSASPTGAVVVAQGADDLAVRLNLIRAIRTLLGLPESAVDVIVMEGSQP